MKFTLYIAMCIALIYYAVSTTSNPRLETLGTGEYCIYSREVIQSPLITKRIDSGIGYIYYCKSCDAPALRNRFSQIDGESITLTNTTAESIFKALNYHRIDNTYGYSSRGKSYIKFGTKKINLQVIERGTTVIVGWPVILGSY